MARTWSQTSGQFKLDLRSQKAQGIYIISNNKLTASIAASAGAIHYATALPPSMRLACPRSHGTTAVRKSRLAPGVYKAHMRAVALGLKTGRAGGGHKKKKRSHGVRRHSHRAGTTMRKKTAPALTRNDAIEFGLTWLISEQKELFSVLKALFRDHMHEKVSQDIQKHKTLDDGPADTANVLWNAVVVLRTC